MARSLHSSQSGPSNGSPLFDVRFSVQPGLLAMLTMNPTPTLMCDDSYRTSRANVSIVMNTQREMLLGQVVLALLFIIAILLSSQA